MNALAILSSAAPLLLVAPLAQAQEKPQAFLGARIIPITGPEIPKGVLVVHHGRIVAVGPEGTPIPEGALRVDLSGKVLMPGLVDTHSHVGSVEGADASGPIQPDVRALDAIDVRDPRLQKARAGGITTVNVMPGSGHLLSGQTVYLKLRQGTTVEDLLLPNPTTGLLGGMKMANGTNSRRKPPFPGTRAKSAALVREQYVKAQEYRDKIRRANGDPDKLPPRDEKGRTVWVTRTRPKVDRIACPWLIRRFVDPNAVFLFVLPPEVTAVAERFNATPFDIDDVFWSHRGDACTFDTMIEEFGLKTAPLLQLAKIVRGADTAQPDLTPQSAGLLAASLGYSRMYREDLPQLEAAMGFYDAMYRWCRDATAETHNWPGTKPGA